MTGLSDSQLFDDYKVHVDALTSQYTRMWTRFNFFITIHSALLVALVGLFKEDIELAAIAIPALGLVISAIWYVTGAQDRYMVGFYRAMIAHAAERIAPNDHEWVHPGLGVQASLPILAAAKGGSGNPEQILDLGRELTRWRWEKISVTRLPALVPVSVACLWFVAAVVVAVGA